MKRNIFFTAFFFVVMVALAFSGGQPSAFGKLILSTSKGKVGLRDALVVLESDSIPKKSYKTYADSRGNFAFYNIPQGTYHFSVFINGKIASQQLDSSHVEKRVIFLSPQNARIGEITILK